MNCNWAARYQHIDKCYVFSKQPPFFTSPFSIVTPFTCSPNSTFINPPPPITANMVAFSALAFVTLSMSLPTSAIRTFTYIACFDHPGDSQLHSRSIFQSVGGCDNACVAINNPVIVLTNSTDCLCGFALPPPSAVVDDSWCDVPCPGYIRESCGAPGFFSVRLYAEPDELGICST
ncbi:uncharacterized protein GGS25DRAFT_471776 [Hypoxylon fragiforme]|uniref:uncharacterized protein n=1 Tax=Hypoxylon fragiforme TaxID=63214 RepID=UPI0020C740C1|nr:uncharacterized protein GGS25DRAFT_471776 [Hypoxylon fragiforme]KAI2614446.1 hypothetical protein GGS25DRAFT_471776 [Hypoxylon fragiforme]